MSCVELARTFLFLADRGIAPHLDAPVIAPIQSRQVNALMMTSGMYQNAGEFALARWPAGEIGRRRRDRGDCPAGDGDRRVEPGA